MKDLITNKVILEHIHAMKYELKQDIRNLDKRLTGVEGRLVGLEEKVDKGFKNVALQFENVALQFEDAALHRKALQEDLEATILMQGKHEKQLSSLRK